MTSSVEMANEENKLVEENYSDGRVGVSGKMEEAVTLKKGPWTAAEDAILIEYVKKNGQGNWNAVQKNTGLARCGKSCRLRWANHLRPNLKKGAFSLDEEKLILQLHAKYGNKWAKMATVLPGRTDNEIKNFWNTRVKRRQRQGLLLYSDELEHPSTPTTPATPSTPTTPTTPTTTKFDFLYQNHYHHHSLSPTPPLHSPLSSPVEPKLTFNALSSFDSSSPLPLSTFQRPPPVLCNPLHFKRYRTSPRYPVQVSSTPTSSTTHENHTLNPTQLVAVDAYNLPLQLNRTSSQFYQTPSLDSNQKDSSSPSVFPTRLELPSYQFSQQLESEIKFDMLMNDIASHTSSDFPGDILMEAEALASGHTSNKRSYSSVNEENYLHDDLPLTSLNWPSTTSGLRPKEETQDLSKCTSEDLSLFNEMPSTLQIPDWQWHNESAATTTATGMSSVQTSNSIMLNDNSRLDMKPMASPFPITTTTNHNESTSYYTWDNLPGLC